MPMQPMNTGKLIHVEKKKIRAIAVSKNENREIWSFERSQVFIPSILQFLLDMGFSLEKDFEIKFFFGVPHEDDSLMSEEYVTDPFSQKYLPIDLFNQQIISFNKKNLDIEIIFFSDRILLTIRSNKKTHEIGKLISKFSMFVDEIE